MVLCKHIQLINGLHKFQVRLEKQTIPCSLLNDSSLDWVLSLQVPVPLYSSTMREISAFWRPRQTSTRDGSQRRPLEACSFTQWDMTELVSASLSCLNSISFDSLNIWKIYHSLSKMYRDSGPLVLFGKWISEIHYIRMKNAFMLIVLTDHPLIWDRDPRFWTSHPGERCTVHPPSQALEEFQCHHLHSLAWVSTTHLWGGRPGMCSVRAAFKCNFIICTLHPKNEMPVFC